MQLVKVFKFSDKMSGFNRALSKFLYGILYYLITIIEL